MILRKEEIKNFDYSNTIIIDVRFDMFDSELGIKLYNESHIEGAYFFPLDLLFDEIKEHGGRHPMRNHNYIMKLFSNLGLSNDKKILIYDDGSINFSAKLWHTLKTYNIDSYVVDGGFDELKKYLSVTDIKPSEPNHRNYEYFINEDIIISHDEFIKMVDNDKYIIIDSRAKERYSGIEEPMDYYKGHIPSATNIFWKDLLDGKYFLSKEEYKEIYKSIPKDKIVVAYCGSGVTACMNVLALDDIGIECKLYLGSFSDYITYKDNFIVIKGNKKIKIGDYV